MLSSRYILFDLDETLYPASNGLMDLVRDKIVDYIVLRLGVSVEEAEEYRSRYLREYGVTLGGLRHEHGVDVRDYMEFVHDVPHSDYIIPNPELDAMLARLDSVKVIFTNADCSHVRRVLSALRVDLGHFHSIFDYEAAGCCPKPELEAYKRILDHLGADGDECILVEDNLRNLAPARRVFGMRTVLVDADGSRRARGGPEDAADWVIRDILDLERVLEQSRRS